MCLFECVSIIMLNTGRRRNPEPPLNINNLPWSLICVSTFTKSSGNAGNIPFGRWGGLPPQKWQLHAQIEALRHSSPIRTLQYKYSEERPSAADDVLWMRPQGLWNPRRALPSAGPFLTIPPSLEGRGGGTSTLHLQVAFFLEQLHSEKIHSLCGIRKKSGFKILKPPFFCADTIFRGPIWKKDVNNLSKNVHT